MVYEQMSRETHLNGLQLNCDFFEQRLRALSSVENIDC